MELFFNTKYKDKLNSDSKILYGFLLNRLTLSAKNNWIDEDNNYNNIGKRKNSFFSYEQRHYENLDFLYAKIKVNVIRIWKMKKLNI